MFLKNFALEIYRMFLVGIFSFTCGCKQNEQSNALKTTKDQNSQKVPRKETYTLNELKYYNNVTRMQWNHIKTKE